MSGAQIKVTFVHEGRTRDGKGWVSAWSVKVVARLPCGNARGQGAGQTYQKAYDEAAANATRNAAQIQRRCASSGAHAKHANA